MKSKSKSKRKRYAAKKYPALAISFWFNKDGIPNMEITRNDTTPNIFDNIMWWNKQLFIENFILDEHISKEEKFWLCNFFGRTERYLKGEDQ